ncbi:MAG: methylated-DNA--[protein]-cysteine S-methyltransferase [Shimia sp.]
MTRAGLDTPIGALALTEEGGEITAVDWAEAPPPQGGLLSEVVTALALYFAGGPLPRPPLRLGPGAAQARFQRALLAIPDGETRTYGEMAAALGLSAQAAGQACGANRLPVLVPCHRVLGAQGLGGYSGAGGVEVKVALLRLEGAGGLLI